jgi:hypothetical protein
LPPPTKPFLLEFIFQRVSCFCPRANLGSWSSFLCLLHNLDHRHGSLPWLVDWGKVLLTFCLGGTWTKILLSLPAK